MGITRFGRSYEMGFGIQFQKGGGQRDESRELDVDITSTVKIGLSVRFGYVLLFSLRGGGSLSQVMGFGGKVAKKEVCMMCQYHKRNLYT